jgi:hypothetical protein
MFPLKTIIRFSLQNLKNQGTVLLFARPLTYHKIFITIKLQLLIGSHVNIRLRTPAVVLFLDFLRWQFLKIEVEHKKK